MNKLDIVKGYNGVMALDLTNIDPVHRKQAVDQHLNDIKIYTQMQNEMSPRLRYENTIGRIQKLHKRDREANAKRLAELDEKKLSWNILMNEGKY